jgi:hypothetical protein
MKRRMRPGGFFGFGGSIDDSTEAEVGAGSSAPPGVRGGTAAGSRERL